MSTQFIYNLTDTWNSVATTFTAIGMNVTDVASASGSMLIDLQHNSVSQFHVTKAGVIHGKRINFNITSANTAIISASNYSLTGSQADSMVDLAGTWNTSGTPTALKLNMTDTASNAASALMDLQVGGVSQFKVSKAGAVTAVGVAIPTISSTDTLSNKTLSSPTLSGTVAGAATFSGAQTFTSGGPQITLNPASGGQAFLLKEGSSNRWIFGTAAGTGTGSNLEFYNYTIGANELVITASTGVVSFRVAPSVPGLTVTDATNIALGSTTGTKIGTATTEKLGFFNATPIVQPTAVADATGAGDVVAQLNALLTRMRNLGLIAT